MGRSTKRNGTSRVSGPFGGGAERVAMRAVERGDFEIDADGTIWRVQKWGSTCDRKRAETITRSGYLTVRTNVGGKRVCAMAHRLVWHALRGTIPATLTINHLNGRKSDNRPGNLEVVTMSENIKHAFRIGTKDHHGERNPACTLTDAAVASIRDTYAKGGTSLRALAKDHGCCFQTISKLIRGERRP
jgi:hypothetical protein